MTTDASSFGISGISPLHWKLPFSGTSNGRKEHPGKNPAIFPIQQLVISVAGGLWNQHVMDSLCTSKLPLDRYSQCSSVENVRPLVTNTTPHGAEALLDWESQKPALTGSGGGSLCTTRAEAPL